MKSILALAVLATSISSFAATVKVSSFRYIRTSGDNYQSPLAELCGKVSDAASTPSFVKVLVDPGTSNVGTYNTVAGEDGNFCMAVITYRGRAEASIMGEKHTVTAQIK